MNYTVTAAPTGATAEEPPGLQVQSSPSRTEVMTGSAAFTSIPAAHSLSREVIVGTVIARSMLRSLASNSSTKGGS